MQNKETLIVIPARLASVRLPGKLLMDIHGKSMIHHVYERARATRFDVVVATEDREILDHVIQAVGGHAVQTGKHQNGTSRCIEAFHYMEHYKGKSYDTLINVQGDEPMLRHEVLHQLAQRLDAKHRRVQIATVAYRLKAADDLRSSSSVYMTKNQFNEALYFSRSVIPFMRDVDRTEWIKQHTYLKHIGIYAFHSDILEQIRSSESGILDQVEKLEQLRWLEQGWPIGIVETDYAMHSVDTLDDLEHVRRIMRS